MEKARTYQINREETESTFLSDILILIKSRLTLMVVFTSVAGFVIVSGFQVSPLQIGVLFLGGFLVAGASNALNQVLEKDFDIVMKRTANRPVATGRMTISTAVMIAGLFSLIGITVLALFNPLTAFLGTLSLLTYSFVYTPLKRHSAIAVLIGAIPGAMPVLIGCVAFEGVITPLAITLFAIQFFWQIPHFWSIGFLSFEDYKMAGFRFIPEQDGSIHRTVMIQSLLSCLLLIPFGVIAGYLLDVHGVYTVLLFMACTGFAFLAFNFLRDKDRISARRLMFGSLIFLPAVLTILLISQI